LQQDIVIISGSIVDDPFGVATGLAMMQYRLFASGCLLLSLAFCLLWFHCLTLNKPCLIKTATNAQEIFFQQSNICGGQMLRIARRETFIVPDCM